MEKTKSELYFDTCVAMDGLTCRELRGIAKEFHVALGYDASRKTDMVSHIASQCNAQGDFIDLMERVGMKVPDWARPGGGPHA